MDKIKRTDIDGARMASPIARVAAALGQPVEPCPGDNGSLVGLTSKAQVDAFQKALHILRILGTVQFVNGTLGAEPVLDSTATDMLFQEIYDIAAKETT